MLTVDVVKILQPLQTLKGIILVEVDCTGIV